MPTNSFCNFFFIFTHLVLVVPQASATYRQFIHVSVKKSWFEAQQYCREHHTDLATIQSVGELFGSIFECRSSDCWIGLHYNTTWIWSDGENFNNVLRRNHFYLYSPISMENCIYIRYGRWYPNSCDERFSFLCYDSQSHERPILMQEQKTWEEAVEVCMSLGNDPDSRILNFQSPFTLAYIDFGGDTSEAVEVAQNAQTEEVWIGLRFLAGRWLWVNGAPLLDDLPMCPKPGRYCGAMSKTGQLLPEEDCVERRNFFCGRRH